MKNDLNEEQLRQEVTVTLPLSAVLRLAEPAAQPLTALVAGESLRLDDRQLPVVGADWQGGKFAGLTLDEGRPAALVLVPGDFKGTWHEAMDWAEKEDAVLPSRIDQLVLWRNLKGEFKDEWYWSCEQHADDADWAWCQLFHYGNQSCTGKGYKLRARAVRRLPL